ncbi:MAG TPA: twin-arginine translocase TatA/TatE family subunit [Bacteroidetes bacterium]|nr:twin-arginine translocase TatA/TatE family subunit [Bacteroidota bacterium]
MFGSLGPLELMIIFIIILVVFGADKLPELARGLGKGMREFKKAADEVKREIMVDPSLNLDLNDPLPEDDTGEDPYQNEELQADVEGLPAGGPVSANKPAGNLKEIDVDEAVDDETDIPETKAEKKKEKTDSSGAATSDNELLG